MWGLIQGLGIYSLGLCFSFCWFLRAAVVLGWRLLDSVFQYFCGIVSFEFGGFDAFRDGVISEVMIIKKTSGELVIRKGERRQG